MQILCLLSFEKYKFGALVLALEPRPNLFDADHNLVFSRLHPLNYGLAQGKANKSEARANLPILRGEPKTNKKRIPKIVKKINRANLVLFELEM